MKKPPIDNHVGLIHVGKRERSGIQILKKLNQHDFIVNEWDVLEDLNYLSGIDNVDVIVVNIGETNFEYDKLLSMLFEMDTKIIMNEAQMTNQLTGVNRQSWERHLLNKIDSSFSLIPEGSSNQSNKNKQLDLTKFNVNQVWVLAASIGGPEAIQKFLAEFKGTEKILFIIIQHIDSEFMPMLAQQFSQVCDFNVEIPISGLKINHSSCIIYPTDEHVVFKHDGVIELQAMNDVYSFSPCIDEACKLLSENIKNINMAVFSGMSTDGINGAKYIKDKGGKVITQIESSCVLSSIITGVKQEMVTDFNGIPAEMARYILRNEEYLNGN